MAAVIGSLRAELSASIAKFREDMGKAAESVRQFADKAEKQGKRLSDVGAKLSLAVTAPIVAFGVLSFKAAQQAKQALGQVEAALASTGNRAGRSSKQLQDSAKALESLSTFDDEDILAKSTANLLKFGNVTGDVFDRAQKSIVDMASRSGDLESATRTIGRALNDPIEGLTALTRIGVQFTNDQKEQIKTLVVAGRGIEAQVIILKALEAAYGGAAKAQRDATPTAALAQSWRDLTEVVGAILIDVLPPLISLLKTVADLFKQLSPAVQKTIVIFAALAAALGPVLFLVGNVIRLVGVLTPAIAGLTGVLAGLTAVTWGWIAAIAAVVAALVIFWKSVKDILQGDFVKAWEDAKDTARQMWDDLSSMFKSKPIQAPVQLQIGTAGGGATPVFSMPKELIAARKTFETDLAQMSEKISSAFRKVDLPKSVTAAADLNAQIDEFVAKAKTAGLSTAGWSKDLEGLRTRIESLKQAGLAKEAETFARAVDESGIAVNRFAAGSLDPLNERLTTIDQAYLALKDKIVAQIDDNRELANVSDDAAAAMARLEQQLHDLESAHAKASEAAVVQFQAEQKLADIQARREVVGAQESLVDLHKARGDAGPQTALGSQQEAIARDLEDKALQAEEKLAKLQADRAQAELVGDTAAMDRLDTQIILQEQLSDLIAKTTVDQITAQERLQKAFDELSSGLEDAVGKLLTEWKIDAGDLKNVLKQVVQSLFVRPVQDAIAGVLKAGVSALTSWAVGGLGIGGGGAMGAGDISTGDVPGHAAGGFIPPGQWGWTGEKGPELAFGGRRGLSVFPSDQSQRAGGRGDVIQNFNIVTPDADSFRRSRRQIQREQKLGLG